MFRRYIEEARKQATATESYAVDGTPHFKYINRILFIVFSNNYNCKHKSVAFYNCKTSKFTEVR